MPKGYQDTLGNMRLMTDFWVNVWFLRLLVITEYLLLAYQASPRWARVYIPLVGICIALFASFQARVAVEQWGEWVKASFDVYLPMLCEKWGFVRPHNMEEERKFWGELSRAMVFCKPSALDALDRLRKIECQHNEAQDVTQEEKPETTND